MTLKNKVIIKNTLFLYFRMILILVVSLYSSRVVLEQLGVEDFGIYHVVAGVISLLTFVNGALSTATQRFICYELGKTNSSKDRLEGIFTSSFTIHLAIGVIFLIVGLSIGVWVIREFLTIPTVRLDTALLVFYMSLVTVFFNLISIPYIANIISFERMSAFAYISIADAILKLCSVLLLSIISGDKLLYYAVFISLSSTLVFLCYVLYNKVNLGNTKFKLSWNKEFSKKLVSYIGWNFYGNIAAVVSNYGVNILLNITFGTVVNAARAIAMQVNSAVFGFVSSLQTSFAPQIIKSYSGNDSNYVRSLIFSGAKLSFFLLLFISTPILAQTDYVLKLWLGSVPDNTEIFVKLVIIDSLVISLSGVIMTTFQATGKIKLYQVVVGTVILLNLPVSYLMLNLGGTASIVYYVAISISIIALILRLTLLYKLEPELIKGFVSNVILRVTLVSILSFSINLYISSNLNEDILGLFSGCITSVIVNITVIYLIGIDGNEKAFVRSFFKSKFSKAKGRTSEL
ncbi:hypothetical protein QTO12_08445 [Vibrio owensii]|uniref:hypothetical protein n=1 Tax=Vibrio owensii TaxID=696485 RepID=UPI002F419FC6